MNLKCVMLSERYLKNMLYDSVYITFRKSKTIVIRKQRPECEGRELTAKGYKQNFLG